MVWDDLTILINVSIFFTCNFNLRHATILPLASFLHDNMTRVKTYVIIVTEYQVLSILHPIINLIVLIQPARNIFPPLTGEKIDKE